MKTKEDLLKYMECNGACEAATEWVKEQDGSFADIVRACDEPDWLAWLLAVIRPRAAADLATRAVKRMTDTSSYDARVAAVWANRCHSMADEDRSPVTSTGNAIHRVRLVIGAESQAAEAEELEEQLRDLRGTILELV